MNKKCSDCLYSDNENYREPCVLCGKKECGVEIDCFYPKEERKCEYCEHWELGEKEAPCSTCKHNGFALIDHEDKKIGEPTENFVKYGGGHNSTNEEVIAAKEEAEAEEMDRELLDKIGEMVNHPKHYETGKYECIEVMEEALGTDSVYDFCICNAFKYLYRHKRKRGIEDLKKAQWYLGKAIELNEKVGGEFCF